MTHRSPSPCQQAPHSLVLFQQLKGIGQQRRSCIAPNSLANLLLSLLCCSGGGVDSSSKEEPSTFGCRVLGLGRLVDPSLIGEPSAFGGLELRAGLPTGYLFQRRAFHRDIRIRGDPRLFGRGTLIHLHRHILLLDFLLNL